MVEISYKKRTPFDEYLNFPAAYFRYYNGTYESIDIFCGKILGYIGLDSTQEYKIRLNISESKYWFLNIVGRFSRQNNLSQSDSESFFYSDNIRFEEKKCQIGVKIERLNKIGNENPKALDLFFFEALIIELAIKSMIPKDDVYINIKWSEVLRRAQGIFNGPMSQEHWTNKYATKRGKEKMLNFLRNHPNFPLAYVPTVKALIRPGRKKAKGTSSPFFSYKLKQTSLEELLGNMGYEVKDIAAIRKNQKKRRKQPV